MVPTIQEPAELSVTAPAVPPAIVIQTLAVPLKSGASRDVCADRYSAVRSRPILRNLPPAFVWTYRLDTRNGDVAKGR